LDFFEELFIFLKLFPSRIDEIEDLLNNNRIWYQRLNNIGIIKLTDAINFGFSGVLLRGSGLAWDLRDIDDKTTGYDLFNLSIPIGFRGDCYDRFLIRLFEMRASCFLVNDVCRFFFKKSKRI